MLCLPILVDDIDRSNRRIGPQLATEILEQLHETAHQRSRSTAREEHAPLTLNPMNQRVDGAGVVRIPTNQQRVKAEGLSEVFVLDEPRNRRIDAAVGSQSSQLRCDANHIAELKKWHRTQFFIAFVKDSSWSIPRTGDTLSRLADSAFRSADQLAFIGRVIKRSAVRPLQSIHGMDWHQFDIVIHRPVGQTKQLLDAMRSCDHGRALRQT